MGNSVGLLERKLDAASGKPVETAIKPEPIGRVIGYGSFNGEIVTIETLYYREWHSEYEANGVGRDGNEISVTYEKHDNGWSGVEETKVTRIISPNRIKPVLVFDVSPNPLWDLYEWIERISQIDPPWHQNGYQPQIRRWLRNLFAEQNHM